MIWISSKTRNDSKSLDELTERGLRTMFQISGDVFLRNERWFIDQTANFSYHKQPTFLVVQLFQIFIYFYTF